METPAAGTSVTTSPAYGSVIIIGAGIAGLSAACHLLSNCCTDIKILEARDRIGGRIWQTSIGADYVELGANWIHGILDNPIYELALKFGLTSIVQSPKSHSIVASTEQGKQVPFDILHEVYEAYMCFLKRCEEYFMSDYLPPDGIDNVGDHIRLEMDLYLDKYPNGSEDKRIRELLFTCLLNRECCISGCNSLCDLDLIELGSYTELQGGNITLPKGYSSILEPLSQSIPKENILLEQNVKSIRWNSADNDGLVEVECTSGKRLKADHIICTVPLGVLKSEQHSNLFVPPLPREKQEAISRLLFGTVNKIFLEYDRPILNAEISEILLLWDCIADVEDMQNTWFKKIYSFSRVTDRVLLGWVAGKQAEYMETLSDMHIIDTCTTILRKFLNDPFIPKAKSVVCTHWYRDVFSRGSYTSIAVGSSQADIEVIMKPLFIEDKPVVLFAGEHTHKNFYSTVHGAFLSGQTAASWILNYHTINETEYYSDDKPSSGSSSPNSIVDKTAHLSLS